MDSNTSTSRLRELNGSGYEIVDGQPNIIGWTIRDNFNNKIGVVDDLLFDPELEKVRYIIANLRNNDFDLDKRKVLIPIGIAELHESNDDVIVSSVSAWQLRALPTYGQRFTDNDEREIYTVFSSGTGTMLQQPGQEWHKPTNFYDNPTFNHDNLYKKRRANTQVDTPIERKFRMRPGAKKLETQDYTARSATTSQDLRERTVYDHELETVGSDRNRVTDHDDTSMRHETSIEKERVLSRIRRMHDELDEIERDLRTGRGT